MGLEDAIDKAVDAAEADTTSGTEQVAGDDKADRSQASNDDKATQDGSPDNWLSYLEEKGVDGTRLEQSKRYYAKAREAETELDTLRSEVETLKGKDALEDYIREEYGSTYTNIDDLLSEKSPRDVLKMIQDDLKSQASGDSDTSPPPADKKYAELEKKFDKLQDEIFEQKMEKEIFNSLDELEVEGEDRALMREYVDERWYLAPPKMEMKTFVKKCWEKFKAIRGTPKQEEGLEAEPEKASKPKKAVTPKPKSPLQREPRVKNVDGLFEGKGNALDKALDKVLGSGAS